MKYERLIVNGKITKDSASLQYYTKYANQSMEINVENRPNMKAIISKTMIMVNKLGYYSQGCSCCH